MVSHCMTRLNTKAVLRQAAHTVLATQRLPALHRHQRMLVLAVTQPVPRPELKGQL